MSTPAFEDFYFDVCTADYAAMEEAQKPLVARMEAADRVRIVAPGTELEFSIKGIPVIPCSGDRNIPDGEVFTAPVRDSINGKIRFNTPSRYQGIVLRERRVRVQRTARSSARRPTKRRRSTRCSDSDEGARYCGEWAIGVNNRVREPMLDTLFDEKIGGSFHLTPGQAYEIADNGNRSRIHWDLVLIQRPDYGGGEIWFDGELLRKDGKFVPERFAGTQRGAVAASAAVRVGHNSSHGRHGKMVGRIAAVRRCDALISASLHREIRGSCRMKSILEPARRCLRTRDKLPPLTRAVGERPRG